MIHAIFYYLASLLRYQLANDETNVRTVPNIPNILRNYFLNFPNFPLKPKPVLAIILETITIMTQAKRLEALIIALKMSIRQFEIEIDVGSATIDKAIKRNSKLGFGTVHKILQKFPNVNKEWLENGKGEMFNKPTDTKPSKSIPEHKGSILEYMLETGKDYAKKLIDIGKYPTAKDISDLEELAKKIEERKKSGE